MSKPIINPSTLTEEQREAIRAEYEFDAQCYAQFSANESNFKCVKIAEWHKGRCDELESLFGKEMFEEDKK